uniref:Uncharacterized protein n=1 Tax=Rhizophora mucronata TaxID=61149 RepID=A0A2P2NW76_RHIMU
MSMSQYLCKSSLEFEAVAN